MKHTSLKEVFHHRFASSLYQSVLKCCVVRLQHHCFVQALLARGYLAEADARSLFRKIVRQNSGECC